MNELVTILVCVSAVFVLYWLIGWVFRRKRRERMKQQGSTISWGLALERVRGGDGFFVIAVSGQDRELCYVPGDVPSDTSSVRDAYNCRMNLVEGYCGKMAVADLKSNGIDDRCVELNIEALVV